MKIVMFNYTEVTSPGGVHKTIIETAKNLANKGHEIIVIQGNNMDLPEEEIYEGFKIIRIKSRFADKLYGFAPEIHFFLNKFFSEINPDIVHIHGYHTLFSPEILYAIKRIDKEVPIIFSPHFDMMSHNRFAGKYLWKPYNQIIGKKFINIPDIIIAASKFESENLISDLIVDKNKLTIIPHGINFEDLKKIKRKDRIIRLLYVGHLLELKGVQHILKAVNYLIYKKNVKVIFTIIGEGPYEENLRKLSNELKINSYVNFEGFIQPKNQEKLLEFYKNSDISLLLSNSENFGIVVSESLAMGTPVIVYEKSALVEFLAENGCFGVNDPTNTVFLADLILKIYNSDIKVGPFSEKIRNWTKITEKYERLYKRQVKKIGAH